jgi:para-aminobenzoate synthetase/4-amino-4-deoxychorismate lyase
VKESSLLEYALHAVTHPTTLPQSIRTLAARSRDAVLLETARWDAKNRHSYLFLDPVETLAAHTLDDLPELFARLEKALAEGRHVAGYVGYECGVHFALRHGGRHAMATGNNLPLAWFGIYARPFVFDHDAGAFAGDVPLPVEEEEALPARVVDAASDALTLEISRPGYINAIERIKQYIAAGDTYQVNFTDAVRVHLQSGAAVSFGALLAAQPVSHAALLNVGGSQILSLSPELFFRVDPGEGARRIVTRPMKGTMRRGLDASDDAVQAALLAADEKNRSEHVMIVDLLRNDLGRICEMGSVVVEDLFTVERYRTLLQMTSAVEGRLRDGTSWYHLFRALFPSGSITGAPKIRTMEIIDELEREPRGVYTGAIGYIAPSGAAQFNVAIRTLVVNNGEARMGVGGGIVADSEAESEYRECQLKASFLTAERAEFELIETMLVEDGTIRLLPLHLDRVVASADYFGFSCDRISVAEATAEQVRKLPPGRFRLRLLLGRDGVVTMTHIALGQSVADAAIRISRHTVDSRDLYLRHKTTRRALYDSEFAAAQRDGFDEVLFVNQRGELTEGAISTLFLVRDGRLLTPPFSSGVLPGVLRRSLLDGDPTVEERVLTMDDLVAAGEVFIGNSVRGLRRVQRIVDAAGHVLSASLDGSSR